MFPKASDTFLKETTFYNNMLNKIEKSLKEKMYFNSEEICHDDICIKSTLQMFNSLCDESKKKWLGM